MVTIGWIVLFAHYIIVVILAIEILAIHRVDWDVKRDWKLSSMWKKWNTVIGLKYKSNWKSNSMLALGFSATGKSATDFYRI